MNSDSGSDQEFNFNLNIDDTYAANKGQKKKCSTFKR